MNPVCKEVKMLRIYPAIFHKENNSYWVEFPDLLGCNTEGETLEQATIMSQEAMGLYINSLIDRGLEVPVASDIRNVCVDVENDFVSLVYCEVDKYRKNNKAVKKTLTIPQWLDDLGTKNKVNFSGALKYGVMVELGLDDSVNDHHLR